MDKWVNRFWNWAIREKNLKMEADSCDVLILVSTETELAQLSATASDFGMAFDERSSPAVGQYYWMGQIGDRRVIAVKTRVGSYRHQASTSKAILCQIAFSSQSMIQLGMAFGINREKQRHGEVLYSESIFPYDDRTILEENENWVVDYDKTTTYRASRVLIDLFERQRAQKETDFEVHSGVLLSGGALIRSQAFLRELVATIEGRTGSKSIVGGEMEGVGLLAVSARDKPLWIVVKGICDFADDRQQDEVQLHRELACRNAARFVLLALQQNP